MAPIEVIDLISDDDDDEPPTTTLLKSFQVRAKQDSPVTIDCSTASITGDRQQASQGINAAKQTPRAQPAPERAERAFTPPALSEDGWDALGSPGRKLKHDLARIQRHLNSSHRQSELPKDRVEKRDRIEKAERYKQKSLLTDGGRSPRPRHAQTEGSANGASLAPARPERPEHLHMTKFSLDKRYAVSAASTDGSGPDDTRTKRLLELPATGNVSNKKLRVERAGDQSPPFKDRLVDVTDAILERFTTSSEPEQDRSARLAAQTVKPEDRHALRSETKIVSRNKSSLQQSFLPYSRSALPVPRDPARDDSHGETARPSDIVERSALRHNVQAPVGPHAGSKKFKKQFTAEDNALLKKLKSDMNMEWFKIHRFFPNRSLPTLQVHYSTKVNKMHIDTSGVVLPTTGPVRVPHPIVSRSSTKPSISTKTSASTVNPSTRPSNFGTQYTAEEAALLKKLKEDEHLDWKSMVPFFNGRTAGSLQFYYFTKVKQTQARAARQASDLHRYGDLDCAPVRPKRARRNNAAIDGFISWTDAESLLTNGVGAEDAADDVSETLSTTSLAQQDTVFPRSLNRILRYRELGHAAGARAWTSHRCSIPEGLQDTVYKDYRLQQYYHGTSGDVVGLSWSASGRKFAAGSIAITDNRSMQYNMSRNLLVGDYEDGKLQELVEHHVARPIIDESDNPNALGAMRQTQDPRLFLTVTATAFSPQDNETLFTTGQDKILRKYVVPADIRGTAVEHTAEHTSSVDLLAVNQDGLVATGCHSVTDNINIFRCDAAGLQKTWTGTPEHQDMQSTASLFPSTLKWGAAHAHRNYLLAGFSSDEDKLHVGETVLWDVEHQAQLELRGVTRTVSDVCWNPRPSSASVVFAIASSSAGLNFGRGMRSAVSCFAPTSPLSAVIKWQCPALDINDVLICPHNDQLVAAGATDGKVYVWDQRWAGDGQAPLHVLSHGDSLNVLPHGYDREVIDTGVRFLSWGATSSRLYTGSSDGIVKVWNPYRSEHNAHVEDFDVPRQHRSAVMSGVFSPDYQELLVGTENGRINVFKIGGHRGSTTKQMRLHTAAAPAENEGGSPFEPAHALLHSGKIIYRRCGAMPLVQAVQGETYDGPFQAPSRADAATAEQNLHNALDAQADVAARCAQEGVSDPDDPILEKAQIRVRDAQAAIDDLRDQLAFAETSRPAAEAFQHYLRKARKKRKILLELEAECFTTRATACDLDCRHLPTSEEIDDDRRSELRVPGTLRNLGREVPSSSSLESDEQDTCVRCCPFQARKRGKQHRCLSCTLKDMRLTTTCSKCAAPARLATEGTKRALCEACKFACFRCAGPVKLLDDAGLVTCEACELSWTAGVLGYDLVETPSTSRRVARSSVHEQYDDFGTADRERLADKWIVAQEDDKY